MYPLICVSILVHDEVSALDTADQAKDAGADLVEWRIDDIFHGQDDTEGAQAVENIVDQSPLPCIVTCRASSEGGGYDGDDDARIALYEKLGNMPNPPRYLDLEYATYSRSENIKQKIGLAITKDPDGEDGEARSLPTVLAKRHLPHLILPARVEAQPKPPTFKDGKPTLILSSHDFETRPADLTRRVLAMNEVPTAGVTKIAFRARSIRDNLELFDLLPEQTRPTIALAMGEHGLMSRVLAPKFGGHITYASLRKEEVTAPGQPTVDELINLYGFRWIDRMTKVYGVIGDPVGHSLSPMVHNAGFKHHDINAVYLPLPVASSDDPEESYTSFKATLDELIGHHWLDFYGCSVTMPHKQNLVRYAKEKRWILHAANSPVDVANTLNIVLHHNGKVIGPCVTNTDVEGAVGALVERLWSLKDKTIAIIGYGGVARAIAFGAAMEGAKILLMGRNYEKAGAAAIKLRMKRKRDVVPCKWEDFDPKECDVIINATPVGMEGGPDPDGIPFPEELFDTIPHNTIFFDAVYTPRLTPMLRESQARGYRIIDGTEMFIRQAAAQFALWTKLEAPVELYSSLVRKQESGFQGRLCLGDE